MAEITVERRDVERILSRFEVEVREDRRSRRYDVSLSAADFERLGGTHRSPEEFVRACFEFLLRREPMESILSSFDISEIGRYFPEFEREILRA